MTAQLWTDGQLRELDDALATARAGQPTVLVVEGRAGTGKSSLLEELVGRPAGLEVIEAEALEEDRFPFGVCAQWGIVAPATLTGYAAEPFVCHAAAAAATRFMIPPKIRDPRLITIRRGGNLTDGQAGAVAHESAGRGECRWQRDQLPAGIRALVLDDQRVRNNICWSVFDC